MILLAIPDSLKYFADSFEESFRDIGLSVFIFFTYNKNIILQRKKLLDIIRKSHIEKLLVINIPHQNAEFLFTPEILDYVPCYLWLVDTIKKLSIRYPYIDNYQAVYSFEPADIQYCRDMYHHVVKYLPLTAGKTVFCSSPRNIEMRQDYDVCFVGLVAGSQKRLDILRSVADYCVKHHKKLICYGHFWHNSHIIQSVVSSIKFWKQYPELFHFVHNEKITPHEASRLYKKTKICLNIHDERHTGFNCRTFEILGNGNFQLCDKQNANGISLEDGKDFILYEIRNNYWNI